jgi:3-deoxy-D-manno-octulosonate 8-phosphate phosphatase (KDO 8-P phosphatase)
MLKLVIIDVDGVMCHGKHYDLNHKCITKTFNDLDFTAIKVLKSQDVKVAILSGDMFNKKMAQVRKIPFYFGRSENGVIDKLKLGQQIAEEHGVTLGQTAYVGDDYFDIDLLMAVRFAYCPKNAPAEVRSSSWVTLQCNSGEGVISEMVDWLINNKTLKPVNIQKLKEMDKNEHGCIAR